MNAQEYAEGDITRYWDTRHKEWAKSPNIDIFREKDLWFEERFAHLLPIPRGKHPAGQVLDYGCGCGMYSVPLLRRFEFYIGVDTSEAALAIAKMYFSHDHASFSLMSPNSIGTKVLQGVCDCVISITVLQHQSVPIRLKMIEEIKRVLKPGGKYVGVEMMGNTQAADMPPMSEADWLEAWRPLSLVHDVPAEHPEWAADNIWHGV